MSSPSPHHFWFVEDIEGVTVFTAKERLMLDEPSVEMMFAELTNWTEDHPGRSLLLNLGGVESMSELAGAQIFKLNTKLQQASAKFAIISLNPKIGKIFDALGLNVKIPVATTRVEAFSKLASARTEKLTQPTNLDDTSTSVRHPDEMPVAGTLSTDEVREIQQQGLILEDAIEGILSSWK